MQRLTTHLRIRSKTLPTLLLALGSLTTTDASVSGVASVQQASVDNERGFIRIFCGVTNSDRVHGG